MSIKQGEVYLGRLTVQHRGDRLTGVGTLHDRLVVERPRLVPTLRSLVLTCLHVGRRSLMDELTHLAHRARLGDRVALERLATACYGEVWRFCAGLVDPGVADDLAQETLARVVRGMRRFRGEASARTWVLAIARHVCMDELRARARETRREQALVDSGSDPVDPDARGSIEVRDLLSRLDPDRRIAFVLTQLLRTSYAEAAEICGCPTGTIRSRVARAREDLIRQLEPHPGEELLRSPEARLDAVEFPAPGEHPGAAPNR